MSALSPIPFFTNSFARANTSPVPNLEKQIEELQAIITDQERTWDSCNALLEDLSPAREAISYLGKLYAHTKQIELETYGSPCPEKIAEEEKSRTLDVLKQLPEFSSKLVLQIRWFSKTTNQELEISNSFEKFLTKVKVKEKDEPISPFEHLLDTVQTAWEANQEDYKDTEALLQRFSTVLDSLAQLKKDAAADQALRQQLYAAQSILPGLYQFRNQLTSLQTPAAEF